MRAVAAVTLVLAVFVSGCSGEQQADEPIAIDEAASSAPASSSTPSPSLSASARPSRDASKDDTGTAVVVGAMPSGGAQLAAAEAYVEYLKVRTQAFNTVRLDLAALSSVAVGDALQSVQGGVAYRSRKKLHMVGGLEVDVTDVSIRGRTARLTGCLSNSTAEANRKGRIVEKDPPPFYRGTAELRKFGPDVWLVSTVDFQEVTGC
jgi:hypothetical protein